MSTFKRKVNFFESEEGLEIKRALATMESDTSYTTEAGYSANEIMFPDNHMPFVDKHMHYLSEHRNVNPQYYLSNLRLMTKVRTNK